MMLISINISKTGKSISFKHINEFYIQKDSNL